MKLRFYVVCDDYVGSEPAKQAAIDAAAALDAHGEHTMCTSAHAVISATSPTDARNTYYRKISSVLHSAPAP